MDMQESRLWDHARFNLMLLYGGRRGGGNNVQGSNAIAAAGSLCAADLDI
jgi:hypothetical protein